jgi:hypothetical protein
MPFAAGSGGGDFIKVALQNDDEASIFSLDGRIHREDFKQGTHAIKLALGPGLYVVKLVLPGFAVYEKIQVCK